MVMQRGTWAIWSRGNGPFPLAEWKEVSEHFGVSLTFEELLAAFLVMKQQGQHVRLEWMPEAAYGSVPKSNADYSEAELRERNNFYGDNAQLDTEREAMELGFGYV